MDDRLRRDALATVDEIDRRQAPPLTPPPIPDPSAWNTQTETACTNALANLKGVASNPSGLAVCYNLPYFDMSSGVFEAELRMFNVSPPTNEWTGVQPREISVTLSYLGATVQRMVAPIAKREAIAFEIREREITPRQAPAPNQPQLLKVLTYAGQINSNLIGPAMTLPQVQPLLIPQVSLAAKIVGSSAQVNATLSNSEASFVNGVFSDQGASTITAEAAASASAAAAAANPFVLPGVTLGIFPLGFIITAVWMVLFVSAVGLGTLGRVQFRDQYRRRMQRDRAGAVKTI
ncbi:hypothetical protein K402DRAFT_321232 [Aulographum hederae CBS 113979]|uniref:Uncharacterized protein n=1 Tax=Aulographum hederae CBS 113979 TaxID=1176131 RepID=A0A6G1HGB1_9PEZI|nr:hypothetical protein K402DRAFT_321232 [Aulographum hederae CBS 113979]